MSMETTFHLKTSIPVFVGWYDSYVETLRPGNGRCLICVLEREGEVEVRGWMRLARQIREDLLELRLAIWCTSCHYSEPQEMQTCYFDRSAPDELLLQTGSAAIQLHIWRLGTERLMVTVKCCLPDEIDVFAGLLRKIAQLWDEARQDIMNPRFLMALQPAVSTTEWAKWEEMIEAVQQPERQPLPSHLEEATEPQKPAREAVSDVEAAGPPLPKKAKTREKWKKIYSLWLKLLEEYRDLSKWDTDSPEPTMDDLRDAVIDRLSWAYTPRRLRDVIRTGEAGLLR